MDCLHCGYINPVTVQFCKNCERSLHAAEPTATRPEKTKAIAYAGFWLRFVAAFLDMLLLCACVILLLLSLGVLAAYLARDRILYDSLTLPIISASIILFTFAYFILLESGELGATIGKRWMNIRVQDKKGNRITRSRAAGRLLASFFSFLPPFAGFITQPFTRKKQALHDLLSGTTVVRASKQETISFMATLLVLFFVCMVPLLALFPAIGYPLYQQYILSLQMEKGMQSGTAAAMAVSRFYQLNGRAPVLIIDADSNFKLSPHVDEIDINQNNGELTLRFSGITGKALSNKHLIFSPSMESGQPISWKCRSTDIADKYLPASCK